MRSEVFRFVHRVGYFVLRSLQKLANNGIPKIPDQGSKKKSYNCALPPDTIANVVRFLETYAGVYGLPQPVPPRGNHGSDQPIIYLPASYLKTKIHKLCSTALSQNGPPEEVSYHTFRCIWKTHAPRARCMKRMFDVCAMCDQLRGRVSRAPTEEETQRAMQDLTKHIEQAQMERDYYRSSIAATKDSLATTTDTTHVTFDYAQQLKLLCHTHEVCSCLA